MFIAKRKVQKNGKKCKMIRGEKHEWKVLVKENFHFNDFVFSEILLHGYTPNIIKF